MTLSYVSEPESSAPRRGVATREPVNVSIDAALVAEARALGIPLSATFEAALRERVIEARRALWLKENDAAVVAYNERVGESGVFSDGLRRF